MLSFNKIQFKHTLSELGIRVRKVHNDTYSCCLKGVEFATFTSTYLFNLYRIDVVFHPYKTPVIF